MSQSVWLKDCVVHKQQTYVIQVVEAAVADSESGEGLIHSLYVAVVLLCKPHGRRG